MPKPNPVYEQTYRNYLDQIKTLDLKTIAMMLGMKPHQNNYKIRFLGQDYFISEHGFYDRFGATAPFDICIVLCRYLIMCPQKEPHQHEMVSFRDFKDSGPLIVYFSNEVERKISEYFAGRMEELVKASKIIGGYPLDISADYDFSVRFDVLPKIPVFLLYNDPDNEFDAQAKLLFQKRAERYLDAECLAILGNILYQTLIKT